jgi:hypothetical protein
MRNRLAIFVIAGLGVLPCRVSIAQGTPPVHSPAGGARDSVESTTASPTSAIWIAGAAREPVSNQPGVPADRMLLVVGLERRFEWARGRLGAMFLAPSVLPGVYTTGNRKTVFVPCDPLMLCAVPVKYAAYGIGVIPLGLRFESVPMGKISVAARLDGGGVRFNRRIPADGGMRFNFLAQGGVDLSLRVATRSWIQLGYRHLHLSNAGTSEVNPGLDVSLLDLGLAWR